MRIIKVIDFILVIAACSFSQLQFLNHYINDTLKSRDTIFFEGSDTGVTTATVTLTAQAGVATRAGLNIMLVTDFSTSMEENAMDTAAQKVYLMRDAVRQFIDRHLKADDGLAMARYAGGGYQFFPEKERSGYGRAVTFLVRVEMGGRVTLRDTLMPQGCRKYRSTQIEMYAYDPCEPCYGFGATLGGRDYWGNLPSVTIGGTSYGVDSVVSDSVILVAGNPPLSPGVNMTTVLDPYNFGHIGPVRDEYYADTFYFFPGSIHGQVDTSLLVGFENGLAVRPMLMRGSLGQYLSFGIEKLWWSFNHFTAIAACCGWDNTPHQRKTVRVALVSGSFPVNNTVRWTGGRGRLIQVSGDTLVYDLDSGSVFSADTIKDVSIWGGAYGTATFVQSVSEYTFSIDTAHARAIQNPFGFDGSVDGRLGSDGTSTYFTLWHAIRYALRYNDKGAQPVIILLTDGADEHSVRRFRSLNPSTYWTPIPSMFQPGALPSDTSFTTMQTQFLKFMDSINANTGGVKIHVVVMDTAQKPDYSTLYYASVIKTGGSFSVSRGSELDSIYNAIGASIRTKVARPVSTSPIFVDELAQNLHYKPGTLISLPANTVSCSTIVIDSSSGRTRFYFYVNPMDADQVFAYRYTFSAYLNPPSETVTPIVLNADPAYSRAQYLSSTNVEESKYFPRDTIYVLSKITGLVISSLPGAPDTAGTTRRPLTYTMTAPAADTAQAFYTFMGVLGSADTLYKAVSGRWNFNPLNWTTFGSRSITNVTSLSVTPYVKLGPSMTDYGEQYLLTASYTNPQSGSPMTDEVAYVGIRWGQNDFVDSVVISTSREATGIRNPLTVRGSIDYLAVYPGQPLWALAHWRVSNAWTVVAVDWSAPSGFTRYNLVPSQMTGTDSSRTLQLKPNPDPGNPANQSDTGYVRISYTNVFNDLKEYSLCVEVVDTTVQNTPNAAAIFTEDKYLSFRSDPAKLESLYYYFDTLSSYTVGSNDTDVVFYGLLFCVKGGTATFMGLDSAADWNVNSSIAGKSLTRTGSELAYSNTFAPRSDIVTLNSSIDSTAVLTVTWGYGTGRYLSLETKEGSVNDNLAALPEKSMMLFDPNISSDVVYGVVRDQYNNYVPYSGYILWHVPNSGYQTYITITDTGNPCLVSKVSLTTVSYFLVGTLPAGSVAGGVSVTQAMRDTLSINMVATGFDGMVIRVASGYEVRDTAGVLYNFNTDIPNNRVVSLRAGRDRPRFAAYIHRQGQPLNFPTEYMPNYNALWRVTDTGAFARDPAGKAFTIEVAPSYSISRDTLIAEWAYGASVFRDTLLFRVLPGYPTEIRVVFPDTVTAGDAEGFRIVLIDANGDTVTDPSLYPVNLRVYASDTSVGINGGGGWTSNFDSLMYFDIPVNFGSGVSLDSLLAFAAGSAWVKFELILPGGVDTFAFSDTFVVIAGAASQVRIVRLPDNVEVSYDTLSTVVGGGATSRQYLAVVQDAYGNAITDASVLVSLDWDVKGTLDSLKVLPASLRGERLTYNAAGSLSSGQGMVVCRVSPAVADSFLLNVFAPVRVVGLVTREWIADTGAAAPLSADAVLSSVFGVDPSGLTGAGKLDSLAVRGYRPYLDGYLDYLDLEFSNAVYISDASLDRIAYDPGLGSADSVIVWKGSFSAYPGDTAGLYAVLPSDGKANTALDSAHTRYRVWLRPSFLVRDVFNLPAFPQALETGFKPVITFDNKEVQDHNPKGVSLGIGGQYSTGEEMVTDSAAPVLSKVLFYNNKCNMEKDKRRNEVRIYFSEPLKVFSDVSAALSDFRAIRAFTVRKQAGPGAENPVFMGNPSIIVDGKCVTDNAREANPIEAARFTTGQQAMMYYLLTLNPDTAVSLLTLSNEGNEMRFTVMSQSADWQAMDAAFNSGNMRENGWVRISTGRTGGDDACDQIKVTLADVNDALQFSWDNQIPLFPYWGITLMNQYAKNGNDSLEPLDILINVYIFDVLGNLVASPDKNLCLGVVIPGSVFSVGNGRYAPSYSFNYDYLVTRKDANSGSPCGILPAWNALNNKGRLVAPGGYVIRMVVSDQIEEPRIINTKLVMTRRKR